MEERNIFQCCELKDINNKKKMAGKKFLTSRQVSSFVNSKTIRYLIVIKVFFDEHITFLSDLNMDNNSL